MAKVTVCEDDLRLADELLEALGVDNERTLKPARRAVATWIARLHERAVACAAIRAERERTEDSRKIDTLR